jgi:hypothetical protein
MILFKFKDKKIGDTEYINYYQIICAPTFIERAEYEYLEEGGEDGDLEFHATFQKMTKKYITQNVICSASEQATFEYISMHSDVEVYLDGSFKKVKYFRVTDSQVVLDADAMSLRLEFQVDYSLKADIINNCELLVLKPCQYVVDNFAGLVSLPKIKGSRAIVLNEANVYIYGLGWIVAEVAQENNKVLAQGKWFYYMNNWIEFPRILQVNAGLTTLYLKGTSANGYIRIEQQGVGTIAELIASQFRAGVNLNYSLALPAIIRAIYYQHGCTQILGEWLKIIT